MASLSSLSIATAPTGGTTGVVWWSVPPPLHLLLAVVVGTGYQPVAPPGGLPVVPVVAITSPVHCCWYGMYGTQVLVQGGTKYTQCPTEVVGHAASALYANSFI